VTTPPQSPAARGKDIAALEYAQRFVTALPADSAEGAHVRTVLGACYSGVSPDKVADPKLLVLVPEVCVLLDLTPVETPELVEVLAGNRVLPGMAPYAACYGGHQFGSWAGQLGDGRAITLGEVRNGRGELWEVQLKGAGRTPYSRRGDGRAVLRSSLRELVCSEAMHHLGVPSTRALSLVVSGDSVLRDLLYDGRPRREPGAITCRVAPSFLRFGNYEIFAARKDQSTLHKLVQFTLDTFFPELAQARPEDIVRFFELVCVRTAHLISEWMRVGFVHGVMNTDNMSILGLTLDYGPYGFLDVFDPSFTPNITDGSGRYAYGNQPSVAQWNLSRLGGALAHLLGGVEALERGLDLYASEFERVQSETMLSKLGLKPGNEPALDDDLFESLFTMMTTLEVDMTLFFRELAKLECKERASHEAYFAALRAAFYAPDEASAEQVRSVGAWVERYAERTREDGLSHAERKTRMDRANPLYLPRNYLVQLAIERAEQGDLSMLHELMDVLRRPYTEQPGREQYAEKRPEWARNREGCSMLSCSS
jgi:uncharacterized protein YdiU (UPF0061 family)